MIITLMVEKCLENMKLYGEYILKNHYPSST
jgi:hypothetical protein